MRNIHPDKVRLEALKRDAANYERKTQADLRAERDLFAPSGWQDRIPRQTMKSSEIAKLYGDREYEDVQIKKVSGRR